MGSARYSAVLVRKASLRVVASRIPSYRGNLGGEERRDDCCERTNASTVRTVEESGKRAISWFELELNEVKGADSDVEFNFV